MRHPGKWLVVIFGLLAATAPDRARAETFVTESELLAALDANPAFRAALNAPVAIEKASVSLAGRLEDPSIATEREDAGDAGLEWTWTARWTPPLPGRRQRARDHALAAVDLAESQAAMARLQQRNALRAAFADWALAAARWRLAEGFRRQIDALAKNEAARAEAGEVAGLSARRFALATHRASLTAERLAATTLTARGRVEALVGALPTDVMPQLPTLPPPPVAMPAAVTRGVGQHLNSPTESGNAAGAGTEGSVAEGSVADTHPRMRAAAAAAARDRLALDRDRAKVAAPEIEIGWKRVSTDDLTFEGPVLGLSWRVPLAGRRKARVAAAEAAVEGSEARMTRRALAVTANRSAAMAAYAHRHATVAAQPAPDDRLRTAAVEAYRLGEGSLTDLLDILDALRGAASDDLDLLAEALAAHRALELAVGHSLETTP